MDLGIFPKSTRLRSWSLPSSRRLFCAFYSLWQLLYFASFFIGVAIKEGNVPKHLEFLSARYCMGLLSSWVLSWVPY